MELLTEHRKSHKVSSSKAIVPLYRIHFIDGIFLKNPFQLTSIFMFHTKILQNWKILGNIFFVKSVTSAFLRILIGSLFLTSLLMPSASPDIVNIYCKTGKLIIKSVSQKNIIFWNYNQLWSYFKPNIESNESLENELCFISICSVRILSRKLDILKNNLQISNFIRSTAVGDLSQSYALRAECLVQIEQLDFGTVWFSLNKLHRG